MVWGSGLARSARWTGPNPSRVALLLQVVAITFRIPSYFARCTPPDLSPSRRTARSDGHVTGAELVERCRAVDPATTPSTVYRTLDVLEELGIVRHAHGADG